MSGVPKAGSGLARWFGSFADLSLADQRAVVELVKAGGAIQGSVEEILPRLCRTRMMALLREGERGRIVGAGALRPRCGTIAKAGRSEEHTSELQSLMRISYAVFCLKKKK